jgi:hypothetical protein
MFKPQKAKIQVRIPATKKQQPVLKQVLDVAPIRKNRPKAKTKIDTSRQPAEKKTKF